MFPKHIVKSPESVSFLRSLLDLSETKQEILFSLGVQLVGDNDNINYLSFLSEYDYQVVKFDGVPVGEFDLLGAAYQFMNTKFENLAMGSFYTSRELAAELTSGMSFDGGETLFDPSCGSGVFLFASDAPEDKIFGVDFDPIAVMIAKFNFFLKFPDASVYPNIYESGFLEWFVSNKDRRFTYIVGNPPYGANLDLSEVKSSNIVTGESFSYFIEYGFYLLEQGGLLSYLVPEALLNVRRHVDVRDFIMNNASLVKVRRHKQRFAGVMSDIYQVDIDHSGAGNVEFLVDGEVKFVDRNIFKTLRNRIFTALTVEDFEIIDKVKLLSPNSLAGSAFALGVVTGDNASRLLDSPTDNTEPIFTGKEISKYVFLPVNKHIVFDRSKLQQVAPDVMYRAPEKLVYKVISKQMKVAIDLSGSLTSSSANIIIPTVEGNNVYSVALLLNSELYSFLNQKLHGSVNKMSKEGFEALPLPAFSDTVLAEIQELVERHISGQVSEEVLQSFVYDFFSIGAVQREYVKANIA